MKKIVLAAVIALYTGMVSADNFATLDIDHVRNVNNRNMGNAQTLRVGKDFDGFQLAGQARNMVWNEGGAANNLEITAGKKIGLITPFLGMGFDNGYNGAKNADYQYGLVGASAGTRIGTGFASAGIKARMGSTASTGTKQTVAFGTYSVPVNKTVDIRVNLSKSYQDIRENAYGVGVGFKF